MAHTTALATVPRSVNTLRERYLSMKGKIAKLNDKAGEAIEGVVKVLEIQAGAFIFGAIQGAFYEPDPSKPNDKPGVHVLGIPVEAIAGVGLIVGGFMGLGGAKWSDHLTNLGNGALAAYTSNLGRGWGFKFKADRKAKAGGTTKGDVEGEGGSMRDQVAALLEGDE
jgi:hypothetical protein